MAPNVFDYIRNCIHRTRDDHSSSEWTKFPVECNYYSSDNSSNNKSFSFWKDSSNDYKHYEKFEKSSFDKSTFDKSAFDRSTFEKTTSTYDKSYVQYIPSSEVSRNYIHPAPNKDVRELREYEDMIKR